MESPFLSRNADLPKCHLPDECLPIPTMTNIWLYNLPYDRPLALHFGSFFLIWIPEVQGQDFFIFVPRSWPHSRNSGYLWSTELMNSNFWWITGYFNPVRCQEENMDPLLSWQPRPSSTSYCWQLLHGPRPGWTGPITSWMRAAGRRNESWLR